MKLVSIIITTKNEQDSISRLLNSIEKQTYKKYEVVLVDNYSIDKTLFFAKKFQVSIYSKGPERSAQRNFGAKKAKGGYLLFLDADMELSPRVIADCVQAIKGFIAGVTIPEKSIAKNYWEKVKAFERSFYNLQGDDVTDAARFFSKEVFKKIGGYDEKITGPEDWDLTETIREKGFKIERIKALIYHYEKIPSIFSVGKKKFYYALKSHAYLKKHHHAALSPKTIYFLRPTFYKQWKKIALHPLLSVGMMLMMTSEIVAGGFGYLIGKYMKL